MSWIRTLFEETTKRPLALNSTRGLSHDRDVISVHKIAAKMSSLLDWPMLLLRQCNGASLMQARGPRSSYVTMLQPLTKSINHADKYWSSTDSICIRQSSSSGCMRKFRLCKRDRRAMFGCPDMALKKKIEEEPIAQGGPFRAR